MVLWWNCSDEVKCTCEVIRINNTTESEKCNSIFFLYWCNTCHISHLHSSITLIQSAHFMQSSSLFNHHFHATILFIQSSSSINYHPYVLIIYYVTINNNSPLQLSTSRLSALLCGHSHIKNSELHSVKTESNNTWLQKTDFQHVKIQQLKMNKNTNRGLADCIVTCQKLVTCLTGKSQYWNMTNVN